MADAESALKFLRALPYDNCNCNCNCSARVVPVSGQFAVHQVDGVDALISGRPDAASEHVHEYTSVASEDRTERFGIPLVRSEAFQLFASPAAAVIAQDGGERVRGPAGAKASRAG